MVSGVRVEHCYMCERVACSREHVPPRNLFPEGKDFPGESYRKDLITVPSCEVHNSLKSKDDEFLMVSICGIVGNNSIGYRHNFGKVNRALRRNSYRLLDKIFKSKIQEYKIKLEENEFLNIIYGTPDYDRLMTCFDHIARGIYFHHFSSRLNGRIVIMMGFIAHKDKGITNFNQFVRDKVELELSEKEKFGENQRVFYYQIGDKDEFGLVLMRLCFYENVNVYAAINENNAELPPNLAVELMGKGVKVTFVLDDRKYDIEIDEKYLVRREESEKN